MNRKPITPKNKTCIGCGRTDQPHWARKKCRACASKDYAKPKQKTSLPARKPTGEADVFKEIAKEREPICIVTGERIRELKPWNFMHVLPKKHYPHFRLYKKNIQYGVLKAHHLFDNGTEKQREEFGYLEGWARLYQLREELINEYRELYGKK